MIDGKKEPTIGINGEGIKQRGHWKPGGKAAIQPGWGGWVGEDLEEVVHELI